MTDELDKMAREIADAYFKPNSGRDWSNVYIGAAHGMKLQPFPADL